MIFSALDSNIRLKNDKSALHDKSWNTGVVQYFNNCGRAMQHMKKIKDLVEYDRLN
jgi:hypothetical protein